MADRSKASRKGRPKGSSSFGWRNFFHETKTPVFVLGKGRRLRFANSAWEALTGVKLADALEMVCSTRRHSSPLASALAPTPDVLAGRCDRVRRPAPPLRTGPPWWDVSFTPLMGNDGLLGIVGFVAVVGEVVPAAARKIPAGIMAICERHAARFTLDLLAGASLGAERLITQVRHAAQTTAPAWLTGEPGSGKETVARVIHHTGRQRERMFVAIDCIGLQPYLIESLLWGHGGLLGSDRVGTVYLKEPAALPLDLQLRLVEAFEVERPDNPRLISGSTAPAIEGVNAGRLRREFDTDLSVLEIRVPPLRQRFEDLPRLADVLLERCGCHAVLDPASLDVLKLEAWPGNIRELADVLGAAVAAAGEGPIKREHLPHALRVKAGLVRPTPDPSLNLDATLATVEKRLIQIALDKAGSNATKAAELLGIWRTRLLRRIEALGLAKAEGEV